MRKNDGNVIEEPELCCDNDLFFKEFFVLRELRLFCTGLQTDERLFLALLPRFGEQDMLLPSDMFGDAGALAGLLTLARIKCFSYSAFIFHSYRCCCFQCQDSSRHSPFHHQHRQALANSPGVAVWLSAAPRLLQVRWQQCTATPTSLTAPKSCWLVVAKSTLRVASVSIALLAHCATLGLNSVIVYYVFSFS